MSEVYANIIIPRPLEGSFTYHMPADMADTLGVGYRVIVPFGLKKFVTGIVEGFTTVRPTDIAEIKDVECVLDNSPIVKHPQIKFWHWIADYYMCPLGDVFKAAVPAGLKIESESVVRLCEDADPALFDCLDSKSMEIIRVVKDKYKMSLRDLARHLGINSAEARVTRLVETGLLEMSESLVNKYRRVKIQLVKLLLPRNDRGAINRAFESAKRSKGQTEALMKLIALSGYNKATATIKQVARGELLDSSADITWENVIALQKKGLVEITTKEVSRFSISDDCTGEYTVAPPTLSDDQHRALNEIHSSFKEHAVTLLHGVTASGKTEVYIHLIDFVLKENKQALFLVPEIALTTQLTRRLQRVFGNKVKIYHSKFSDNERVDIWRDMLSNPEPCVVIGARSAIFLPFTNLGLVIVDEEHEPSYKQYDPAPRYNGRDAAMVLASLHGAKTLLGSATPTVETYYKASESHKYGLVTMDKRWSNAPLPTIEVVDMARERKRRAVDGALADVTIATGRHEIEQGHQVIFFHNRRGFSPRARCTQCQFIPRCDYCDVALTFHKRTNTLECHYCGAVYPVPKVCPECHEPAIQIEGYGTERVEDSVAEIYPEAKILRMDLDTTRNKDSYAKIIDDFSQHKADILIGTQMVTKGLDFNSVGLVGVVSADNIINFPDFRSSERAFNMLEQVSGRAGRQSDVAGKVMIQTYTPEHPVINFVRAHNYKGFYAWELAQRKLYTYPPYSRVINIYLKHRDRAVVDYAAMLYANRLKQLLGNRVKGPVEPTISRIASLYIRQVMLKVEVEASVARVKEILRAVLVELNSAPDKPQISVYYDVDPV